MDRDTMTAFMAMVLAVAMAAWMLGCAASVSWTIGPSAASGGSGATIAGTDHLDPDALTALGEAAGSAAGAAAKAITTP